MSTVNNELNVYVDVLRCLCCAPVRCVTVCDRCVCTVLPPVHVAVICHQLCLHVAAHSDQCTAPSVRRDLTQCSRVSTGVSRCQQVSTGVSGCSTISIMVKKKIMFCCRAQFGFYFHKSSERWSSGRTSRYQFLVLRRRYATQNEAPRETIVEMRNSLKSPIECNVHLSTDIVDVL